MFVCVCVCGHTGNTDVYWKLLAMWICGCLELILYFCAYVHVCVCKCMCACKCTCVSMRVYTFQGGAISFCHLVVIKTLPNHLWCLKTNTFR